VWPALGRRRERVLDGLLREVPVADGADQGRDRPPEVLPEQAVDGARCDSPGQDAVCSAAALARSP
jgi:hypothetical protein